MKEVTLLHLQPELGRCGLLGSEVRKPWVRTSASLGKSSLTAAISLSQRQNCVDPSEGPVSRRMCSRVSEA